MKNRNVRKPLVVQRTLLPKTQGPARQIMTLAMMPGNQLTHTASFMPVLTNQSIATGQPMASTPTGQQPLTVPTQSGQSGLPRAGYGEAQQTMLQVGNPGALSTAATSHSQGNSAGKLHL